MLLFIVVFLHSASTISTFPNYWDYFLSLFLFLFKLSLDICPKILRTVASWALVVIELFLGNLAFAVFAVKLLLFIFKIDWITLQDGQSVAFIRPFTSLNQKLVSDMVDSVKRKGSVIQTLEEIEQAILFSIFLHLWE